MYHVAGVQKLKGAESIVNNDLEMLIVESTLLSEVDQAFHVSFRGFHDNEEITHVS